MPATVRQPQYMKAGAALAAASVAVALAPMAPVTPWPSAVSAVERATRLVADDSILNVPINLFTDILNIPYNEMQNLHTLVDSMFFTGSWFVVSPSNIFGTDPGDLAHYLGVLNALMPFPELADPLSQQLMGLAEAELPVSAFCDAEICSPFTPPSPITGVGGLDMLLWAAGIFSGTVKFPFLDNWFQVPLSQLQEGYTFGNVVDPSGAVHAGFSPGPSDDFAFQGTTPYLGADGNPVLDNYGRPEELMPWANTTFTLDLSKPFTNFFNSLQADPSTNPLELPDIVEFARILQALFAGLVIDFDPLVPGSPLCPGPCDWLPESMTVPGMVQTIGNLWPGNQAIDAWLDDWSTWGTDDQTVNWATPDQIGNAVNVFYRTFSGIFDDSGNPTYDGSDPSLPQGPLPVVSGPCGDVHEGNTCGDFGQPGLNPDADPSDSGGLSAAGGVPDVSHDLSALGADLVGGGSL